MNLCMYVCTHIHPKTYKYIHTHTHTFTYTYEHTHMHTCMHVQYAEMFVYVCAYLEVVVVFVAAVVLCILVVV